MTQFPKTPAAEAETNGLTHSMAGQRLLYSYPQARELLGGVPESTWNRWISEGVLVPVRIGPRRSFVRWEDIERLAHAGALKKGA